MKFIHLSDTHILARDDASRLPDAAATLRAVIADINMQHRDAEICVISGDITHHGRPDQYAHAVEILDTLAVPYILIPGNHDVRGPLLDAFADTRADANGFINHAHTFGGIRFVLIDTIVPDHHHGTLCTKRLDWLRDELARHPDMPTFLFMHHPPMELGLPFLDSIRMDAGDALAEIVQANPQIKHMFFGHLHRPATGVWQGVPFLIGLSSQRGEPLDFRNETETELDDRNPLKPGYGIGLADPQGNVRYHYDLIEF